MLHRAVASALAQTIVLSGDHPWSTMAGGIDWRRRPRGSYRLLVEETGIMGAGRNVGIRLKGSQYIAFLDDDNEWSPSLEVALTEFRRTDLSLARTTYGTLPDGRLIDGFSRSSIACHGGRSISATATRCSPPG